jgi:hypothetical protein
MESNLGEVYLAESSREQCQVEEDVSNVVQQLKEQQAALGGSCSLLETLLLKVPEGAVAEAVGKNQKQSTKMTFGNNNSGFQAGIINISGLSFGGK